jgi:hypothetical protein
MDVDLGVAAHGAEDEAGPAVSKGHGRGKGKHRSLSTGIAIGGEVGGAVVEKDTGAGYDHTGSERLVEALVEADRHPRFIAGAEVDGIAVAGGGLEGSNEALVELGLIGAEALKRLETLDRPQGQMAPAVGWHLEYFDVPEASRKGLNPLRLVIGEIPRQKGRWGILGDGARVFPVSINGTVYKQFLMDTSSLALASEEAAGYRPEERSEQCRKSVHQLRFRRSPRQKRPGSSFAG